MDVRRILKAIGGMLLSVVILIYLMAHIFSGKSDDVETMTFGLSSVDDKFLAKCYMLRNEEYITSSSSGVTYYVVSEGERVRKNQVVANIYGNENDIGVQERISEIDRKIAILKESTISDGYITTNLAKTDASIAETIIAVKRDLNLDRYTKAFSVSDTLLATLNKRRLITNAEKNYDLQLVRLEAEKQILAGQFSNNPLLVMTPISGFFSTDSDGYENTLTPGMIDGISVEGFLNLLENPEHIPNNAIGKIITEYEWTIVALSTKTESADFLEGKRYSLCFPYSNDSKIASALLKKKIIQTSTDTTLLAFEVIDIPENFSYMREQMLEMVRSTETGFKIPKSVLHIVDDMTGVYVLSGNVVTFKPVEIHYTGDSFYLVRSPDNASSPLGVYDEVIIKGKGLYDGKVI